MRALRRLVAVSSRRRTPTRWAWAWVLAVAGPIVVALVLMPFRPSVGLASFLFGCLLVILAVAVLGGVRPAPLAVAVAIVAGLFDFVPPYGSPRVDREGDLMALAGFALVGLVIASLVDELGGLAEGHAAIRRVATLAARGVAPPELFEAVTEEIGRLLSADIATLSRFWADGTMTVVGAWARSAATVPLGATFALGGDNVSTLVARTGRPARINRYPDESGPVADAVREAGTRSAIGSPIVVEGHVWGGVVATSTRRRPLPRDAEVRLAAFTELVATSIANTESRTELAASRTRVVAAADETRRRIERDLHDGTQQRLVSLALKLRAAEAAAPPESTELRAQLSRAAEGLAEVVEELQEISRGIHPAILSKGGLEPAIKMLARRSAVPVELDLHACARLPEPVEVAAYYVVSEALTNAAKHANASVVHVGLSIDDTNVQVSIDDDGVGGADPAAGSGLVGLRDRIETLGGTIRIVSAAGGGTALEATIPIGTR